MTLGTQSIPMRWPAGPVDVARRQKGKGFTPEMAEVLDKWGDPSLLELVRGTPVNCLVVSWAAGLPADAEQPQALRALLEKGRGAGCDFVGLIEGPADQAVALFSHLQVRWQDLFAAKFDVLLYDLTSTYFESPPPDDDADKRRHGYSRDKRSDCVQVVIALIVTPAGFPLAYEVLPGNTSDKTTLRDMLRKIEARYGKANRIWVMDRGIPTEEMLAEMRAADPPVSYLVGTPKGRLSKLEKHLVTLPWQAVREGVDVKLLPQEQELYVLAQSHARINKERAMRRRKLKWLWARLKQIAAMDIDREELLMKLGAARAKARAAWRLVDVAVAPEGATFSFTLDRTKLRQVRRREGRYLLRTNLTGKNPAELWQFYIQLVEVEAAFKTMKDDLQLRPIYHQLEHRIEAHIFVAFLA